jgi:hypothetical protein
MCIVSPVLEVLCPAGRLSIPSLPNRTGVTSKGWCRALTIASHGKKRVSRQALEPTPRVLSTGLSTQTVDNPSVRGFAYRVISLLSGLWRQPTAPMHRCAITDGQGRTSQGTVGKRLWTLRQSISLQQRSVPAADGGAVRETPRSPSRDRLSRNEGSDSLDSEPSLNC